MERPNVLILMTDRQRADTMGSSTCSRGLGTLPAETLEKEKRRLYRASKLSGQCDATLPSSDG